MQFTTLAFLILFAIVTALYYVLPIKWRWLFLLLVSYAYYASWKPDYLLVILVVTGISYFIALEMNKTSGKNTRVLLLTLGLVSLFGGLIAFKYLDFFSALLAKVLWRTIGVAVNLPELGIIAPIGISFYTLQVTSYLIDVFRGKIEPETHFGFFALYVSFFPQIVAGPISRAQLMLPQYNDPPEFDESEIVCGLRKILWGAFQKIAIADRLAILVNKYFDAPAEATGFQLVYATYLFSFQILADFSGYTNMALGMARVLGFNLAKNFDRPYFAKDAGEFWNRWHMSLSTWLRDYIFYPVMRFIRKHIPVAGNLLVITVPPMVTMLVSGLWHGVGIQFIVWGFIHGIYLTLSAWTANWRRRVFSKERLGRAVWLTDFVQIFVTFHLITAAWIFFRASSLTSARTIISKILNYKFEFASIDPYLFGLAVILILILLIGEYLQGKDIRGWYAHRPRALRWAIYIVSIIALLYLGVFEQANFLYAQF